MKLHPMLRPILAVVAVLLLLALAYTGISGGVQQLQQWSTMAQRVQSVSQIVYGVSAIFILITRFRWHRLRRAAELGFIIGLVIAAGLATVVWGGESIGTGVLTGIAALAVAWAIVWMFRTSAGSARIISNAEN